MLRRYIGRARRPTAELVTACLLLTLLPASRTGGGTLQRLLQRSRTQFTS